MQHPLDFVHNAATTMKSAPEHGSKKSREPIKSRRVYYISGFDPRGAAYYHRLYKDEAEKQGANIGVSMEVGSRSKLAPHLHSWCIRSTWHQHTINTDYRFLSWDDIVRQNWETNIFRLLANMLMGYAGYASCGAFGRIRASHRGPFFGMLYPIAFLALIAILSLLVGGALAVTGISLGLHAATSCALGLIAATACGWMGLKQADRLGVLWLLRTGLAVITWGESMPESLSQRIIEFSELIKRDQEEAACDEVILVGHSVGSILAVSVLARMLENSTENQTRNLILVTLGQCIPLLSLVPNAAAFRQDLKSLAEHPSVPWLDMAARADPLCFSQISPAEALDIDSSAVKWPRMHVVRPFRMFSPEKYKTLRRNKLRLHFQYLMSSELQTDYDYFLMTAGPYRMPLSGS